MSSDDVRLVQPAGPGTAFVDGTPVSIGASRTGGLHVAQASAPLAELAQRARIFCATTAQAGVTILAEMAGTIAANKKTILSVVNPINSGVQIHILRAYLSHVSGTPGAGGFAWQTFTGVTTALGGTANLTCRGTRTGGAPSAAQAFSDTALGASAPAHVLLRAFPTAPFAGAIAATHTTCGPAVDYVDGEIVLDPGSAASIAAAATGTTHIVMASIVFAELPYTN